METIPGSMVSCICTLYVWGFGRMDIPFGDDSVFANNVIAMSIFGHINAIYNIIYNIDVCHIVNFEMLNTIPRSILLWI